MKSIQNQYIDLKEGKMSQANFMRNIRMSLPQYITNVTSFGDTVKILKNKGILTENKGEIKKGDIVSYTGPDRKYGTKILKTGTKGNVIGIVGGEFTVNFNDLGVNVLVGSSDLALNNEPLNEAKDEKGKWTNADGKSMYDQFKEIDNLNGQEVLIGIDYEMQKNEKLTKQEATKIVVKNLKKNPIYYTAEDMSGVEGYEPEYIGGKSAQPNAWNMQPVKGASLDDKAMDMKPVKDVEKPKKDSNKGGETNKVVKGVETTSFIAKTVRGVQKMNATGEKVKIIKIKEEQDPITKQIADLGLNKEKWDKMSPNEKLYAVDRNRFIPISTRIQASKMEWDDLVKMYDGVRQGFAFPTKTQSIRPGIGDAIQNKLTKETLIKMIRKELDEITGAYGGDAMSAEDGSSYM